MHHFVTELCAHVHIPVTKCAFGDQYGTNTWVMGQIHCGICDIGVLPQIMWIRVKMTLQIIKAWSAQENLPSSFGQSLGAGKDTWKGHVICSGYGPHPTILICALTNWGRVTLIWVGKRGIIGSDNGLSPGSRQATIWTSDGILLVRT